MTMELRNIRFPAMCFLRAPRCGDAITTAADVAVDTGSPVLRRISVLLSDEMGWFGESRKCERTTTPFLIRGSFCCIFILAGVVPLLPSRNGTFTSGRIHLSCSIRICGTAKALLLLRIVRLNHNVRSSSCFWPRKRNIKTKKLSVRYFVLLEGQ